MNVPAMDKEEDYLALAGHIEYWLDISDFTKDCLLSVFEHLIEDVENFEVLLDWRECHREQGVITHRSSIVLCRAGGDDAPNEHGEGIAVLFCRKDTDQRSRSVQYRVHIPDRIDQQTLLAACEGTFPEMAQAKIDKLLVIRSYLDRVINEQQLWVSLDIAAYGDEE